MTDKIVDTIKEKLIAAEVIHLNNTKKLDGLERVLGVQKKLRKARDNKAEQFESTAPLEALIEECSTRLERILVEHEGGESYADVNFDEWMDSVENDIRAQDLMLFSFASGSSGDEQGDNNLFRRRSTKSRGREGSVSSKAGSTMLDILKSNGIVKVKGDNSINKEGKDDRFFSLTTSAWALAVIGMMITIGFLTGDFLAARREVAIQIERSAPTPLQLPAVTFCSDIPNVPAFSHFPSKDFPGLPLFGIQSYALLERNGTVPVEEVRYPKTIEDSITFFEEVVVAADGKRFRQAPMGFDVARETSSMHMIQRTGSFAEIHRNGSMGLYCFRFGYPSKILLEPFTTDSSSLLVPALQIQIFKLRLLGACRTRSLRSRTDIHATFASEIHLHASRLVDAGVLDFNGSPHSVLLDDFLSLRYRAAFEFYCNVYFFSGFFYPSLDKADISFRYDKARLQWDKTGTGPYFSPYSWAEGAPAVSGPNLEVLEKDTYSTDSIQVYVEDADRADASGYVSPDTGVSILDSRKSAIYSFKRINNDGKNTYEVKEGLSPAHGSSHYASTYSVSFDFATFETETVLTTPTMSWPEFITDVFEFIGLFTGICIFTLIVAPVHQLV